MDNANNKTLDSENLRKNETLEAIFQRRSIRKYKPQQVEFEKIMLLIRAGLAAPSAGNLQDYRFVIVLDDAKKKAIAEVCYEQFWMEPAPVFIVVCSDYKNIARFYGIRGENLYSIQDCAAVIENILIAATSLGLASCWVGAFDEDKLKNVLGIPDYVRPQAVITIGYSDETPAQASKIKPYEVTFLNKYGNKFWDVEKDVLKMKSSYLTNMISSISNKAKSIGESIGKSIKEKVGNKDN